MSSEQPRRARETGGAGGSPIGSTAAIVIAVIAVIGGFLILKTIRDDRDGSTSGPSGVTPTTIAQETIPEGGVSSTLPLITVPPTEAPSTTVAPITTGATVVVANASTVDGAAKRFTTALKGAKFDVASPVNASIKLDVTKVYYDDTNAAALPVATYLASLLGGVTVEVLPSPVPVTDGKLPEGVSVLLMLGSDKADKTLEAAGAPATTTIPGVVATETTLAP